jgi:uncharacterized protein
MRKIKGMRLLLIALACAVAALLCACKSTSGPKDEIRGKIVSATTGKPLARISVGAVPIEAARSAPSKAAIHPTIRTVTDNLGAFRLVIPKDAAPADGYYVFTSDPIYKNEASGKAKFAGQFPTQLELAKAKPVKPGDARLVEFKLDYALRMLEAVRIPMRDKEELIATIALPEKEGKYPAIIIRTPYGREGSMDYAALAREDYAVVIQDVRGRNDSGGEAMAFVNDGWCTLCDGYDTVEWAARQPWCDGSVGSIGASAMGIAQNMMAGASPPHLKAQVIIAAATSLYHDAAYPGGVLRKEQVEEWLNSNDWDELNLKTMKEHPFYDSYWETLDLGVRSKVKFPPAIYIGGWYDTFAEGTLRGYNIRRKTAVHKDASDTYLVMGPWSHMTMFGDAAGEVQLSANAARDFIPDVILFFNHYMKGEDNIFSGGYPDAQYYVLGSLAKAEENRAGNFWVTAGAFPQESQEAVLFLAPDGVLLPSMPTKSDHTVSLRFDPASPVHTRGGRDLTITAGPADQKSLEDGENVISFTSAAISKPMPVAGAVKAQLMLAAEASDADISVRLCDVYPDGTSFLVLDASARMSLPEPYTKPRKIQPGRRYTVLVDLGSIAYIFNAGHRIRIDLAASNYPRFELNPTLAALGKPVKLKVSLGSDAPSSIHFPVAEELLNNGR